MKKIVFEHRIVKSTQLERALAKLREHYLRDGKPDYLVVPYVLTCAAYLEAKLNDSLYEAGRSYGDDYANALMSVSLPTKLKILVPLMTSGCYHINKGHWVYQRLTSLIKTRNSLAHAKSESEEIICSPEELHDVFLLGGGVTKLPLKGIYAALDVTLGANKTFSPLDYHEALDKLDKWFFRRCPDRLAKVFMVVQATKKEDQPDPVVCFEKHLD